MTAANLRLPPSTEMSSPQLVDACERFVVELARSLHICGVPAHHLEASLGGVGRRLGLDIHCFAAPTSLLLSIRGDRTRMLRVQPAEIRLGSLVAVSDIARQVADGEMDVFEGLRNLGQVQARSESLSPSALVGSFAVTSAAVIPFFGGNVWDLLFSGLLGGLVGALLLITGRTPALGRLGDATAALTAGALASLASTLIPLGAHRVTLAALIVLLPGLTLTLALAELTERHLVAGSARLAGASTTFLQLAIGVALGWQLGEEAGLRLQPALGEWASTVFAVLPSHPLPTGALGFSLLVAPVSIAVLFQARPVDIPVITLSCWAGYLGARAGGEVLSPEFGAFFGALTVGLLGKAQSRLRRVPSTVSIVPGILFLVPGSIGFASVEALLRERTTEGIEAAFSMFVVAASLVAGLLAAHALTTRR